MANETFDPVSHGRARGFWLDRVDDDYLVAAIARTPDKIAVAAYRADHADRGTPPTHLTYRELGEAVSRAAGGLRALGVGRGDVVSVQLPNWWEFVVTVYACGRLGAVINPLMPIFRERELGYMLGFAETKVLVVPKTFRGHDHAQMADSLRASLPQLRHVVVVDEDSERSFDRLVMSGEPVAPARALQPDDLVVLMFTSGTTGSPKGVMHTSNTLVANNVALAGRFGLTDDDVLHACSPVGHMTGYAAAMLLSLRLGGTLTMQDVWNPQRCVEIMNAEGVTYTAASTPFLTDLCEAVKGGLPRPPRLRSFLCGGAPIPPSLIERAWRELGLKVCSLWGMTETLSSTLTEPERVFDKSSTSDGRPLEGVEVRIVDVTDHTPVPVGTSGRLLVRGAQNFIGYFKRSDLAPFDEHGWFDTGDVGYADDEGYIRISGRTKDVLIRGGENVPVVEIEHLLVAHPHVLEVAVVGYPDERLGERACAFVVLRAGVTFDLAAIQAHMAEHRVAKQYWPERLEIAAELPRTPSGKVQKFKLRELLRNS